MAFAATAAVAASAVGLKLETSGPTGFHQVFQTTAEKQRSLKLPDGSTLALGANTSLDVRFSARSRSLHLDRGEALFTVKSDANRPFRVFAASGTVTVLGTEFNVWRNLDRTTMTVSQGTVEVGATAALPSTRDGASPDTPARIVADQSVTYLDTGASTGVQPTDIESTMAWRNGQLVYQHTPLKYVIADVNRYFKDQFHIDELAVGELSFSGIVMETSSASDFARALERIFPVEAIRLRNGQVLLRLRQATVAKRPLLAS
jgi:transmembrane sensor